MNPSRYFKLGLFVLAGAALLVGGIVTLGAGAFASKAVLAETYMDEPVTGLEAGSAVQYRGVTVGRVKAVRFAAADYPEEASDGLPTRKVLLELSLDANVVSRFGEPAIRKMIEEGLRARIMRSGLTGSAYLGLDYFDPRTYPPPHIDWTPRTLYIPSVPSTGYQVTSALEQVMQDLQQSDLSGTLKRLDTLIVDTNKRVNELNVPELREQVVGLLGEVRGTNARVKQLLDDPKLAAAVRDIPEIIGRLNTSTSRVDEILHDKRIDKALADLSDAAASAGPAAADTGRLMRDVRALVSAQSDDIRSAITDLRAAMANVRVVTEDAKSNPSRLLLGEPPRRRKPGE